MRLANYRQGLTVSLTADEYAKLGAGKLDFMFPDDAGGFIVIQKGSSYTPFRQNKMSNGRQYQDNYFRVRIPAYNLSKLGLSMFGSQEVQSAMVNGKLIGQRPDVTKPRRKFRWQTRGGKPYRAPEHRPAANTMATDLGKAVESCNELKQQMGDNLVLSIDKNGFLQALVQYSYGK